MHNVTFPSPRSDVHAAARGLRGEREPRAKRAASTPQNGEVGEGTHSAALPQVGGGVRAHLPKKGGTGRESRTHTTSKGPHGLSVLRLPFRHPGTYCHDSRRCSSSGIVRREPCADHRAACVSLPLC